MSRPKIVALLLSVVFLAGSLHAQQEATLSFNPPQLWVNSYGYNAGGWRVDQHPRIMADVNGDGQADVVGFGNAGAYVSLSTGTGFSQPQLWVNSYGYNAGGWRVDQHPRIMADVNGDDRADVVGFGNAGAYVSLSTGTGFSQPQLWVNSYGYNAGGWRVDQHPRIMADVNGDGRADVVGFGNAGAYVSLSTGTGFSQPQLWVNSYGYNAGGWRVDQHPRIMADVNGDGRADVVGFGNAGAYVSLSTGTGFSQPQLWVNSYGYDAGGWRVDQHPRIMADVNGDGRADVVGFGNAGAYVSLSTGTGFSQPQLWVNSYGYNAGGWRVDQHPRIMADVNGDDRADVVGFGNAGAYVSLSTGTGFSQPQLWVNSYGYNAGGWRVDQHPRIMADVNGDDRADVVGFGNAGVYVSLAQEQPAVLLVNIIPSGLSGETNQDSEPFLAVHPTNPLRMAASAFTPNPFSPGGNAPIFVSVDSGNTWALNTIVPSAGMTSDITHASTGGIATLYAGILRRPGSLLLNALVTTDFTSPTVMTVQASRGNVDQPFVQAIPIGGNDRIYVGNNDFGAPSGRTATVDVSLNGGTTYTAARIETRNTSGQNGPSIRPSAARDGIVYAAFFGWRSFTGGLATSDIVVVRDDAGAAGPNPFRALTDTDGLAGRRVVQNVTIPWSNAPTLGQERIGSTLSIAVDPNNSATVYIAWGDRVGTGDIYTIHVRRSTDRGVTWSNDLRTITNATNPALAVADNGTVALLYQQVSGTGASSRWVTHLEQTRNAFTTAQDTTLATVPATTPAFQFLPYIGDYNFLLAVGNEFRGIFSANNTPDLANFPQGVRYQRRANFTTRTLEDGAGGAVAISIDPFYFSILVMQ